MQKHAQGERRTLTPAAMDRLKTYRWKGNVRELENVIERALALTDSREIGLQELPLGPAGAVSEQDGAEALLRDSVRRRLTLRELEELYTEEIMKCTGGNKVQAAKILGIDRKTLYRRAGQSAETEASRG